MSARFLLLVLSTLALLSGYAGASADSLLFLGNEQLPPLIWVDEGHPTGLAVDLTQAAASKAGLSIRIEGRQWATAQQDVLDGKAEALLHISPSPEREKVFDFTDPLTESRFTIFRQTARTDIHGEFSLQGKSVGVEDGGFPMKYLQKDNRIKLVQVPDWKTGFTMLPDPPACATRQTLHAYLEDLTYQAAQLA